AGDDRCMGHFGHLLLELALALAALRAGSGFCSFHDLRFLSVWTTVDEPDCDSLVPRSGCVVGLNSSLACSLMAARGRCDASGSDRRGPYPHHGRAQLRIPEQE